jgi:hypothetical protein
MTQNISTYYQTPRYHTPLLTAFCTIRITLEERATRLRTKCLPEMVLRRILNSAAVEQPKICVQFVVCSNTTGQRMTISTNFLSEIHWKDVTQWMVVEQYWQWMGSCNGNVRCLRLVAAWFRSQPGQWTDHPSVHRSIYLSIYLWFYNPFVGPWLLFQFLNPIDSRTPWTGDQPITRLLPTHRTTHTQRSTHTDIHTLSGIRTHNPSIRASEDTSCLRLHGHCDRQGIGLSWFKFSVVFLSPSMQMLV